MNSKTGDWTMSKVLLFSKYLSNKYKCKVYLKPEWYGETGSHKDKWAKEAIKVAKLKGFKRVVVMSTGNQGLAAAAEAIKNKIECVVLISGSMLRGYKALFRKYGSKLILCRNKISRSMKFNSFVKQGYFPLGLTLSQRKGRDLVGIDGYKKTASEIVRNLNSFPDIVIIPTCYGDFSMGILKGFKELRKIPMPKFVLVRAKNPDGNAAYSISTNTTTPYVRASIKETKGKSIFLKNKDFIKAQKLAKNKLNLSIEMASAGAIVSLSRLKEDIMDKIVVLILTALKR